MQYDYLEEVTLDQIVQRYTILCIDVMHEFGYEVARIAKESNEYLPSHKQMNVINHPTSFVSTWEINDKCFGIYMMEPEHGFIAFKFARGFENLASAQEEVYSIDSVCKGVTVQLAFLKSNRESVSIRKLASLFVKRMYLLLDS